MGDRFQHNLGPPSSVRRKSFFRRIAESISSIVPSTLFSSSNEEDYDERTSNGSAAQYSSNTRFTRNLRKQNLRNNDTQTVSSVDGSTVVNVDLDAAEISEGELSAHSSTSGVSSLIPRNTSKPFGLELNRCSAPIGDPTDKYIHSRSATCSDAMDSIGSVSTSRPPSITPWILSHGYKRPDSPSTLRPTKRQKIACDQSVNSCESDRMSLFYRAKTTYGGAASCRNVASRNGFFEPTTPLRFELEGSRPGSSSHSEPIATTNLSSTARRILESLERFTTPLTTADRVPLPFNVPNEVKCTAFPIKKTFRSHRFPPYMQAYKRLKTMQEEKRQSSSHSDASIQPPSITSTAPTPLGVPSVSSSDFSTLPASSTASCSTPSLTSSNVTGLAFQKLPLLHQTGCKESPALAATTASLSLSQSTNSTSSVAESSAMYTFAPPIRRPPSIAAELVKQSSLQTSPKFSFSYPLRSSRSSGALFHSSDTDQSVYAPADPVVTAASTCSIFMPIKQSSSTISQPKTMLPNFDQAKSWRCETCLLENPQTKQICSACTMPRIKENTNLPSTYPSISNNTDSTKTVTAPISMSTTPSDRWECPVCMIFNEVTESKCIACGAISKSNQTATKTSAPIVQTLTLPETPSKWECPTCMVFNDAEKSTCACCQTPKPGAKIQANAQWECPTCMVINNGDKTSCPCCSTPKPQPPDVAVSSAPTSSVGTIQTKFTLPTTPAAFSFGTGSSTLKFGLTTPVTSTTEMARTSVTTSNVDSSSAMPATSLTPSPLVAQASKASELTKTSIPPFTPAFGNSVLSSLETGKNVLPFSFGKSSTSGSTVTFTMSSVIGSGVSSSLTSVTGSVVSSQSSIPSSTFIFGANRETTSSSTKTPLLFQFGSSQKLSGSSATNGLLNGDTTVTLNSSIPANKTPVEAQCNSTPGGFNFTAISNPSAPTKFEFGASKFQSNISSSTAQPTFTFGKPLCPVQNASVVSSTTPVLTSVTPNVNSSLPGTALPGATPFSFGSSQANPTPSSTTGGLFCFGANNQATKTAELNPPVSFVTTSQPLLFGQSNQTSTSNLFSANSTSISDRKKVQAVRRLKR